ncbi:hypothetical protein HJO_08247 [Hyphomonas johnsonii MHS-2]|uniref:Uncharacterized protein n=1 Tax=Hyphomonas johnsonii MHS-2 TaxID=1280950 RepID=A0A059FQW7_9PROT|nr:hypothetical protein HJO_08247 [Hyphomonas johnsonii MHS-2]
MLPDAGRTETSCPEETPSLKVQKIGPDTFGLTRRVCVELPDGSDGLATIVLASAESEAELAAERKRYRALFAGVQDDLEWIRQRAADQALSQEDLDAVAELKRLTRDARMNDAPD